MPAPPVLGPFDIPPAMRRKLSHALAGRSTGERLAQSGAENARGLWDMVTDPLGTLKGMADVGAGALREGVRAASPQAFNAITSMDPNPEAGEQASEAARAFGRDFYETWSDPGQSMYEDPVGMALTFLPGKKAKEAGKASKIAKKARKKAADILGRPTYTLGGEGDKVLAARAQQMGIKDTKKRVQPTSSAFFETTPEAYRDPTYGVAQEPIYIPRQDPGTNQPFPLADRVKPLVDLREKIAQGLAKRASPHLGSEAQFFYNTGPIRKKAMELGYSKEEVDDWLKEFADAYAATSPRTGTEQNLRNASLIMAKRKAGTPMFEPVKPHQEIDKTTGKMKPHLSDLGYNMMIGPTGTHRKLVSDILEGGIDPNTNPKPATFSRNVYGNMSEATVDTHAIRGALDVLNELQPGSVPLEFIDPKFRKAYEANPASFDPATWVSDTLESQMTGPKGERVSKQVEYAPFADVYKRMGEILGVSPAEAQSLGWFGSGSRTGLTSELKSIPTLLSDRIDVTSQLLGIPREKVFKLLLERKIPLANLQDGAAQRQPA